MQPQVLSSLLRQQIQARVAEVVGNHLAQLRQMADSPDCQNRDVIVRSIELLSAAQTKRLKFIRKGEA